MHKQAIILVLKRRLVREDEGTTLPRERNDGRQPDRLRRLALQPYVALGAVEVGGGMIDVCRAVISLQLRRGTKGQRQARTDVHACTHTSTGGFPSLCVRALVPHVCPCVHG